MRSAEHDQLTVVAQAAQCRVHRFGVRHGCEDDSSATQLHEFRGHILCLTINVMMRAESPGQRPLVVTSRDGHSLETHLRGKLNTEMTQPSQSEYGNQIIGARAAIAQRVE